MLYFNGLVGVVTLGLWIFCIVDVIVTDEGSCRNLPKGLWFLLVLLLPLVGSIVWLVAGRPQVPVHSRLGDPYGAQRAPLSRVRPPRPIRRHEPGRRRGVPASLPGARRGAAPQGA
ncbi:MAG TPA: PLDc N-terminal domain-containing protein [Pseudonocardiaceae bacterium]|nr:PLDc N-terminal domain-containing protein [Pseudonocardiaceae bacterium]